jgi:multidrug efflux pump subunit AcrB
MRDGGDILALGRNVKKAIDASVADLPLGIDATLVSGQPVVVQTAIGEFMESLWQAIAIIMAVSVISLGLRPGSVVALTIPLTIAIVFPLWRRCISTFSGFRSARSSSRSVFWSTARWRPSM